MSSMIVRLKRVKAGPEEKRGKLFRSILLMIGNVETGEWVKAFAMAKPAEIAGKVIRLVGSKQ